MLGDEPGWGIKVRAWIERGGRKVLGPGRVELLGHIDRLHSISAAAKQMKMSYRRAWTLVSDMNDAAGEPLVELSTGGTGGGGARLTKFGRQSIVRYEKLVAKLALAASKFHKPASSS